MKVKYIIVFWAYLLLSSLPIVVFGVGCPGDGGECCVCEDGRWVPKDELCPGNCCYCTDDCNCEDDDGECTGCCKCSGCNCVGDDSKCNTDACYGCDNCDCQYQCDPNCEFCCNGKCYKNWQCCIDSNCIAPKCEKCVPISDSLYECFHWANDPNGASCSTVLCIQNELNSASCGHKGDNWPCDKCNCDTAIVVPQQPEIVQRVRQQPCPGGTVSWTLWKQINYGCGTCLRNYWYKACQTFDCTIGPEILYDERGFKKYCTNCSYPGCN